jgi:transposase
LKANEGWQDKEISQALDVSIPTIERVRKRFVFEGFEASLKSLHSKRIYSRKLDGEQEARLVALVCSSPPEGYVRWSLRLLADRVVQMKIIDSISHETVRQVLGDNELKPWRAERNGVFQQRMQNLSFTWKTFWVSTNVRLISAIPQSGLT